MEFKLYSSIDDIKYYKGSDGRLYSEEQKKVMEDPSMIEKKEEKKPEVKEKGLIDETN